MNRIPGPEATTALTAAFPKLPPQGQVVALATLADRGDLSARPVVMEAASSEAAEVRAAALVALGKLGDRSALNLLAERAAAGAEGEQAVARESLYRLRGADIDGAIVQAVGSAAGRVRIELIRAAGERGIALATDALIASARDNDRDVRRESLKALKDTAAPNHAQPLLDLVLAAQNSAERREAGRTLATVLKKTEQPPLDGVIAAYRSSNSAPLRALLVDVMEQVASGEVLPVLRSALQDGQREVSRAAILALSDWPTAAPMNDLFAVAKADANAASQVLALRGYIKLVSAPSERPATESARLLNEAMGLARQPEERKSVLALLPRYPCREAMQVAEAAQEDAAVANEAKAAMERIARAIEAKR